MHGHAELAVQAQPRVGDKAAAQTVQRAGHAGRSGKRARHEQGRQRASSGSPPQTTSGSRPTESHQSNPAADRSNRTSRSARRIATGSASPPANDTAPASDASRARGRESIRAARARRSTRPASASTNDRPQTRRHPSCAMSDRKKVSDRHCRRRWRWRADRCTSARTAGARSGRVGVEVARDLTIARRVGRRHARNCSSQLSHAAKRARLRGVDADAEPRRRFPRSSSLST